MIKLDSFKDIKDSIDNNKVAYIYVYSQTCSPCSKMKPVLLQIENDKQMNFFAIDCNEIIEKDSEVEKVEAFFTEYNIIEKLKTYINDKKVYTKAACQQSQSKPC